MIHPRRVVLPLLCVGLGLAPATPAVPRSSGSGRAGWAAPLIMEAAFKFDKFIDKLLAGDVTILIPGNEESYKGLTDFLAIVRDLIEGLGVASGNGELQQSRLSRCRSLASPLVPDRPFFPKLFEAAQAHLFHAQQTNTLYRAVLRRRAELAKLSEQFQDRMQIDYEKCVECAERQGLDPSRCPTLDDLTP